MSKDTKIINKNILKMEELNVQVEKLATSGLKKKHKNKETDVDYSSMMYKSHLTTQNNYTNAT
jgi:hypothetical protein